MIRFDYQEPTTLKKVFALMEKHGDDGSVMAGGTSMIIMMRQRLLTPKVVISLARLPKFDKITYNAKDGLRIGAGARHRDIELSKAVQQHYPLLHETFRKVAQPRIRNMGTVGGNLAGGDPLTDPGASLIALDAEVTLTSSKGQRTLPLGRVLHRLLSNRHGARRTADRDPRPAAEPARLVAYQIHAAQRRRFRHRGRGDHAERQRTASAKTCAWASIPSPRPSSTPRKPKRSCAAKRSTTTYSAKWAKSPPANATPPTTTAARPSTNASLVKVLVRRAAQEACQRLVDPLQYQKLG